MTTPFQLSLPIQQGHRNHYLFSDYYLQEILRRTPAWSAAVARAASFLPWLADLYRQEQAQLPHYSETQLEDHWIRPVLTQLNHSFEGQPVIPGWGNIKKPDYIFFPDDQSRQSAVSAQNTLSKCWSNPSPI